MRSARVNLTARPARVIIDPALTGSAVALDPGDGGVVAFRFAETLRPGGRGLRQPQGARHRTRHPLGDAKGPLAAVADQTGVPERHARLHPGDKLAWLEARRAEGRRVLMVGDGLNDGPALAAAHASMSPADAADVARAAAGLVFTAASLCAVTDAVLLARTSRRRTLQSFGIAAVYNALALPLAIAGLVTPLIAAACMPGSSILVVLNALRLKGAR